ncbi:MAG: hypothetical protein RLZZ253_2312 [Verrucomicrobiota bacterium]
MLIETHLFRLGRLIGLWAAVYVALQPIRAAEVQIQKDPAGRFEILRDGKPWFLRGVCGKENLALLRAHGGNSIRTYGIEELEQRVDGKPLLDRCAELGIAVAAGLWVGHERHGFNYSDPVQVEKQRARILETVRKYRSHPALLLWSLGNEMEGPPSSPRAPLVYEELNTLAARIQSEDPAHPVMTTLAGDAPEKIQTLLQHYPNLQVLGINSYAGATRAAEAALKAGWKKPVVIAEYGPTGHWEVPKTAWGAPIEPSNREKAARCSATSEALAKNSAGNLLGGFCFFWGQKQETTSTWYGMFLKTGEKLPPADALCRTWTGRWPANQCPRIDQFESDLRNATVPPRTHYTVRLSASDAESQPLHAEWQVTAESTDRRSGGDAESEPGSFPDAVLEAKVTGAVIRTPDRPGNYRLFVIVRDGHGAASVENLCFRVEPR